MYEFYQQNRDYIRAFIIITILCLAGVWLVCDYYRNEPIYSDTDNTMADIDKRVQNIEGRLDSMSARLDENQKTIGRIAEGLGRSRENAEIVAGGIDQAEGRLDDAIQRSQRIEDIIADIERANRPGTQGTSQTDMAK